MGLDKNFKNKKKETYSSRFNDKDINELVSIGCLPEEANKYDKKFGGLEIVRLFQYGCSSEEANKYDKRFDGFDIARLFKARCSSEEADKYDKRFNGGGIADLFKTGCSPKKSDKYDSRFDGSGIANLFETGCSPEKAKKYNEHFNGRDISDLIKVGCSPEEAGAALILYWRHFAWKNRKKYPKNTRFMIKNSSNGGISEIIKLSDFRFSSKKLNQYDPFFGGDDFVDLVKARCPPEEANKYIKLIPYMKISGEDVAAFFIVGCSPEKAKKYDTTRFTTKEITRIAAVCCSPEEANKYDKRFDGFDIARLFEAGCSSEEANKYDKRFTYSIVDLVKAGRSPEIAKNYNNRFSEVEITWLADRCSPEEANKYDKRFNGFDIARLFEAGCSPKKSNKNNKNLDGTGVYILYTIGRGHENIFLKNQKLLSLFKKMTKNTFIQDHANDFNIIGTGIHGIVFLREDTSWKFTKNISHEYGLLNKIQKYHKENQKNIIKLDKDPIVGTGEIGFRTEYIRGGSLEGILKKQRSLPKNKTIKYASDIMRGLIEMRQAGVLYHRDIRPANIIVDQENDKAIIIDLGIATTDRHAQPMDNRRYGGANDLVSLGQIMYKMAIGDHIFAKSKSMERTTHAQEIRDYRDRVYLDKTKKLLKKHIKQVDERIKDEQLKTLIKACLTAKNYHYRKIQRMMEKLIPNNGQ